MSIGRSHLTDSKEIRDVKADYIKAHIEEYESYKQAGCEEHAQAVVEVLRQLGHEVRPTVSAGAKERAVSPEPLEKAVEGDAPKRRGRPRNTDPK